MPRAEWNKTLSVWTNDGSDNPDVFRFSRPCRLVYNTRISQDNAPEEQSQAYFTYAGPLVSAGGFSVIAGGWEVVWTEADLVYLVEDDSWWKAIWTDTVFPRFSAPPYRRLHVVQL